MPAELAGKAEIVSGDPRSIVAALRERGFANLYVDGGRTIQGFLEADLIDELDHHHGLDPAGGRRPAVRHDRAHAGVQAREHGGAVADLIQEPLRARPARRDAG